MKRPLIPTWMRRACIQGAAEQRVTDLNSAVILSDGPAPVRLADSRLRTERDEAANVEVFFQGLEAHLVANIRAARAVVGCMAWLTNEAVLRALAGKQCVSILVQKEDWLRPDGAEWSRFKIHDLYAALPAADLVGLTCFASEYSFASRGTLGPVRCVGTSGVRRAAMPRMHHKFLVFCEVDDFGVFGRRGDVLRPYAVWTGSFNATANGTHSLENAVLIRSSSIACAYYHEWGSLLGISEPLDWQSEWVQPEYRIGS